MGKSNFSKADKVNIGIGVVGLVTSIVATGISIKQARDAAAREQENARIMGQAMARELVDYGLEKGLYIPIATLNEKGEIVFKQ